MNRTHLLLIAIMVTATISLAQNNVEVVVKNIKGKTGNIRLALFNTEDQFLKTPYKGEILKIEGETMTVLFKDLPAGTYGASAVHDENTNGKLDTGMMGIPKEGFGFSNDASAMFGPPSFKEAAFKIPEVKTVSVTLKYM